MKKSLLAQIALALKHPELFQKKELKKVREQASCDETKCLEENIGLINGDWLCLDCGEKVKPPAEDQAAGGPGRVQA